MLQQMNRYNTCKYYHYLCISTLNLCSCHEVGALSWCSFFISFSFDARFPYLGRFVNSFHLRLSFSIHLSMHFQLPCALHLLPSLRQNNIANYNNGVCVCHKFFFRFSFRTYFFSSPCQGSELVQK